MNTETTLKTTTAQAVIYARVSSVAQMQKGHGLGSQETRCREFAKMKGYDVAEVFCDEAVSGGLIDRPGMQAMLSYLKADKHTEYVVLIDDISRLARDMKAHLDLRDAIAASGARLESPSIEFGEDSDSILVENLLASVSQHQRQKNAEQTRNRMRARVQSGYWPFISCMGFTHVHKPGAGKVLVRDEPLASIIQEGLEGYASGRFQMQAEVKRFFESHPAFPKDRSGQVRNQLVNDILTKPLYAGYVEAPRWGVSLRKGQHEGLISFETFERIQERLKDGAKTPARSDINTDFPLRGSVSCACCSKPLTSCWSKSKTGVKHPYYMCFNKACGEYRKSIRRDQIEGDFEALLDELSPSANLFALVKSLFKHGWDQRLAQAKDFARRFTRDIQTLEKQIDALLDRIVEADNPAVVMAYEKKIAKLEREKLLLEDKRLSSGQTRGAFEDVFELALGFFANPSKLWDSGSHLHRKLVLKLTFADRLEYCRNGGFRTPETTLPFKALGQICAGNNKMADRVGFEPTR
ncbi:MAG: recombinase family protein, partial [Nitratireductor sp.]|nr:recombinase family protein [Nitratireductor sp.]